MCIILNEKKMAGRNCLNSMEFRTLLLYDATHIWRHWHQPADINCDLRGQHDSSCLQMRSSLRFHLLSVNITMRVTAKLSSSLCLLRDGKFPVLSHVVFVHCNFYIRISYTCFFCLQIYYSHCFALNQSFCSCNFSGWPSLQIWNNIRLSPPFVLLLGLKQ